jgi:hypothetical protein
MVGPDAFLQVDDANIPVLVDGLGGRHLKKEVFFVEVVSVEVGVICYWFPSSIGTSDLRRE